ncbi:hypothetical protein [Alteromonas gracilis]|uniref:hypothetical protein n=1 Tax=Alteromonas gracilis TaxID=1479524 RepID=UPI0037366230
MQPFTIRDIQQHAVVNEQSVEIRLALPATPLKTQQWVQHFCALFGFSLSETDWGADRFQAIVTSQSQDASQPCNTHFQCMLCIEWLCEAIWLEPVGTQQSPNTVYQYLQNARQ